MEEYTRIFVKNLRDKMNMKGVTQKDVADAIGVKAGTFNTWYLGKIMPKIGIIEQLASYFGCAKTDLLQEKQNPDYSKINTDAVAGLVLTPNLLNIMQDFQSLSQQHQKEIVDIIGYFKYKEANASS